MTRAAHRLAAALGGVASIAVLAIAAGCAGTGYHWSQLSGQRYYRVPIDTYDVTIVRVDGKTTPFVAPTLIEPGRRQVEVQGPPGGTLTIGEVRSITLDVAPCTRYYLVAQKANALSSDFAVRVDHREPVAGCTPPRAA